MTKKIKRNRSNTSEEIVDPNLEEVDENRTFEIEEDEETNEVIFVHHYRRKFGDDFNADIEHAMNYEEASDMIVIVLQIMERIKARQLALVSQVVPDKSTPEPKEGNPMQGPNNLDGI